MDRTYLVRTPPAEARHLARAGAAWPATPKMRLAPASAGVVTGLAVWLVLAGRTDLAPPPGR